MGLPGPATDTTTGMTAIRYPECAQFSTATVALFDRYIKWLWGQVWGRVSSSPTIYHVMDLDFDFRGFIAEKTKEGMDTKSAFEEAYTDVELMRDSFTGQVSADINTPESKQMSAPGLLEACPGLRAGAGKRPNPAMGEDADDGPPAPHIEPRPNKKTQAEKKKDRDAKQQAERARNAIPGGSRLRFSSSLRYERAPPTRSPTASLEKAE